MVILKKIWKYLVGIGIAILAFFALRKKDPQIPTVDDAIKNAKLEEEKAEVAVAIKNATATKEKIKAEIKKVDKKINTVDAEIKKVRKSATASKKAAMKAKENKSK